MAWTSVRGVAFLQFANMLSDGSVASMFENFSTGRVEKTVFDCPGKE